MQTKLNKLITIGHIINCIWIIRLMQIGIENGNNRHNYWVDPIFVIFLLVSCCFQVYRWIEISKYQINFEPENSVSLKIQLQKITDEMFGKTPYLLKISPGDHLLSEFARSYIEKNIGKIIRTRMALQGMLFEIKNFFAVSLILFMVSGFYIYFGTLPSYAKYLSQIPIISVAVLCMAGGLFVNSAALLMFWVFLLFNKRK